MLSTPQKGEKRKALNDIAHADVAHRTNRKGLDSSNILNTFERNAPVEHFAISSSKSSKAANLQVGIPLVYCNQANQPLPFIVIPQHIWEKGYLCVIGTPDNVSKWIRQPKRGRRLIMVAQYPIANDGEGRKGKTEIEVLANLTDFVLGESDYFDTEELAWVDLIFDPA